MSLNNFKLSCELFGHSLDVRAVTEGQVGTIVSGSRDKTAKVWGSNGYSICLIYYELPVY